MCGGGGRGYGEGLNLCKDLSDLCFGFSTPALVYDKGGGSLRAFRRAGLTGKRGKSTMEHVYWFPKAE